MLRLIPPRAHRFGLRLAHALRKRWWRWRKPRIAGCRVIALDPKGYVLLVRHSYGTRRWTLPGGGLRRGEDPLTAAARELLEETACRLDDPRLARIEPETLHGAINAVHVVAGRTASTPRADGREILSAEFFALDALPEDCATGLREAIERWIAVSE